MMEAALAAARRLAAEVLEPMKRDFIGKDEIIDLLGVALVGSENVFLLGPPGTAKSALVQALGRRMRGATFDYLLTRFTEPNELFGPFDIRRLREGELVTNTEGMLPEASLVFLDELLNANSAILNSLLTALNERMFRRGRESRPLRALMFVAASNHLPEDDALRALFDRFLLRVTCGPVAAEELGQVLDAGRRLETVEADAPTAPGALGFDDLRPLQAAVSRVDLSAVRSAYLELIGRLRTAGIEVSDRRAVKLQRVIAASALLSGRAAARISDLWVLRFIWDREEQREALAELVGHVLRSTAAEAGDHPRARADAGPDEEALARDLEALEQTLARADLPAGEAGTARDRLALLESRIQWVRDADRRVWLEGRLRAAWDSLPAAVP